MKNLLLFAIVLLPFFAHAQFDQWLPNRAMTDSSHQNRNAFLIGQYYENILLWDQELDANTTQICYKNMNPNYVANPQIALYQPNVKLTNPVGIVFGSVTTPSEFLLMYQTNEGNGIDLKASFHQASGIFTTPVSLSAMPGNDIGLVTDGYNLAAWENTGKIYISQYNYLTNSFTLPHVVDSAGVHSPILTTSGLSYLKPNGDSTYVVTVSVWYNQNTWTISPASSQSVVGECSALASSGIFSFGNFGLQSKVGSNPTGLVFTDGWNFELAYMNSPNYNYTQPAIDQMTLITKSSAFPTILAFVSDSLTEKEIFAIAPTYEGLQNISLWPGKDENPKFFTTFPKGYSVAVNLFWESEREGFSTIYGSHYDYLFGGISENQKEQNILAKPCPFDKETSILFRATGVSQVRILDLQGRNVKNLLPHTDADGWFKAVWDGTNESGKRVAPGSYMVVASTGNGTESLIIVKK
jgi:hypothetical protein